MHLIVSYVVFVGCLVLGCGHSTQSLLIDVDSQRIQALKHDIHSEVKLAAFDEHWVGNVLLNDYLVLRCQRWVLGEVYSPPLAVGVWLNDVETAARPRIECLEILRKDPSGWVKLVQFRHGSLGTIEVDSKQVLASQFATAGEVVDLLIALEAFDELLRDVGVDPDEEDVVGLVLLAVESVVEVLVDQVVDYGVLSLQQHSYVAYLVRLPRQALQGLQEGRVSGLGLSHHFQTEVIVFEEMSQRTDFVDLILK